jgi:DNA repair exonuclease SbcCD nuclease subunit
MILIFGDLHLPKYLQKNNYSLAILEFLKWLEENYANDKNIVIFSGDVLDSPNDFNFFFIKEFYKVLSKFKEVYLVTGNHDKNSKGNALTIFEPLKNVHIIEELSFIEIEHNLFGFYPFLDREKYLDYIPKEIPNFTLGHYAFVGSNFGQPDEIQLPYTPKSLEIIGHIHNSFFVPKDKKLCLGSVLPTRFGEHTTRKYYLEIEDGKYEVKEIPEFLKYVPIDYKDLDQVNKEELNIYLVYNCPNLIEAKEKLQKLGVEYKIIESTIKKKEMELNVNIDSSTFQNMNLEKIFLEKFLTKELEKKYGLILEEVKDAFRQLYTISEE